MYFKTDRYFYQTGMELFGEIQPSGEFYGSVFIAKSSSEMVFCENTINKVNNGFLIEKYNDNFIEVKGKYYASFVDTGNFDDNIKTLSHIIRFMKENKISEIYNFSEEKVIHFVVSGWFFSVCLAYAPNNPDINKIRRQHYCNAYYIDKSWLLIDYHDEDYYYWCS